MKWFLFIYFLGYVVSYYSWKLFDDEDRDWESVFTSLKLSFLSWLSVVLIWGFMGYDWIQNKIEEYTKKNTKPPKWL